MIACAAHGVPDAVPEHVALAGGEHQLAFPASTGPAQVVEPALLGGLRRPDVWGAGE